MSVHDIPRCGYLTLPPGAAIVRTSTFCELTWMDEGTSLVTIGSETRNLTRHRLALCPPGVDVAYRWTDESVRLGFILFDHPGVPDWPRFRTLGPDDVLPDLLRHLLWLQAAQPEDWAESIAYLVAYVLQLWTTGASSTDLSDGAPLTENVHNAVAFVAKRWRNRPWTPPTLAELAAAAGVAPDHLSRLFRTEVGAPPLTALRLLRIHRATVLLLESTMTVKQVSLECGFENEYHFSAAFKKIVGTSPQTFRREGRPVQLTPQMTSVARYIGGGSTEQALPEPIDFKAVFDHPR
jgi:AraC-like DNA-binding protein